MSDVIDFNKATGKEPVDDDGGADIHVVMSTPDFVLMKRNYNTPTMRSVMVLMEAAHVMHAMVEAETATKH